MPYTGRLRPVWMKFLPLILIVAPGPWLFAQPDTALLAHDQHRVQAQYNEDNTAVINGYEALNASLGGDSVRLHNGYACMGWVEDNYPDGVLKHRGYYNNGQLVVYKNYHPDGSLEREFRQVDNNRCLMRTYHGSGSLRSEVKYYKGRAIEYADHHPNGQLRYQEEKHRTEPYYLRMDLYAADGKPISLFHLVNKGRMLFEQREYHPNGQLKEVGQVHYAHPLMDGRRVGMWISYDTAGKPEREDSYVDGKVHNSRTP